jgi:hypothetical protein
MKQYSTRSRLALVAAALALGVSGCANQPEPIDYSAFMQAKPASMLVLPPLNDSPELKATPSVWAHSTRPLAEAGYYVLPVTLVDETFRQNGVTTAADAHELPPQKLREYFGADAAVYVRVKQYGTSYVIVSSQTRIEVEARIVDLRSGQLLWQGRGFASSAEQGQQSQGGLVGLLVVALVKQVVGKAVDEAFIFSGVANQRLLGAPRYNGVLHGPRSPLYGQPPVAAR